MKAPRKRVRPTHLDLSGRVAVVTGAARGLGAGIARALADAGAAVVLHSRTPSDDLKRVAQAVDRAEIITADLLDPAGAGRLASTALRRFGRVDILVNNVGGYPTRPLLDMDPADWDDVYRLNVSTTFAVTRAMAPHMADRGAGAIINIASIAALHPSDGLSHYASSKAAILAFTRAAALELGRRGVRVNAVSPGLIDRPGLGEAWPDGVARWTDKAPLRRLGTPDDVAAACLFLASDAASWITGQNLVVDGGLTVSALY